MKRSKGRSTSEHTPGPRPGSAGVFHASGWTLLLHPYLISQMEKLAATSEGDRVRHPEALSASTKLLRAAVRLIFHDIPPDPARAELRQGKTLGDGRKHWFRAKFGGGRFRLFFRFRTDAKLIVYVWMNDENSLRTYGSRTDAYVVFGRMLDSGNPPEDWEELVATATAPDALERASRLVTRLKDR